MCGGPSATCSTYSQDARGNRDRLENDKSLPTCSLQFVDSMWYPQIPKISKHNEHSFNWTCVLHPRCYACKFTMGQHFPRWNQYSVHTVLFLCAASVYLITFHTFIPEKKYDFIFHYCSEKPSTGPGYSHSWRRYPSPIHVSEALDPFCYVLCRVVMNTVMLSLGV